MKKVLPVLLAVVLMLSLSVSAFAANLTPSVDKPSIKAGEAVTVTVTLDKDIEKAISVSYKLRYDANLFTVDTENYVSLCDGGEVTVSEPKTDAKGTYVSISTMDTKSKGQTLKAGDFVAVTFTAKKDVTEQQATFTVEYENSMDTSYGPIAGMGAGPAATVTVTRDYSVTLPEGFTGAATVGHGEDYTFTAQQDPHYDYSFTGSTMGGSDVTVIDNGDGSFKVSKVTGNLVIVSNRTAKTYTVTVTGTGAADATAAATAAYATDYTFTLNKDANYDYTVAVTIGGQSCTPTLAADGKTYTIPGTSITGNIVIHVTKTQKAPATTAISFTGTGSGDVAGGTTQTAENGTDFTFTVDEKEGYTYTVKLGNETLTKTNGQYTIPGAKLTGTALTVTVEKTAKTGEKPLPTPVGPKPEKPEKPSEPGTTEPTEPGTTEPTKPAHSFDDVPAGAYYEEAVAWAAEKGITEGTSATTFAPKALCTRAQVVTFLWRAAGCPEPQNAGSFADVTAGSYYAKAVAWAIENGITGGTGDGMFSPDAVCTRAQAVTFLYRASAAPAVDGSSSFSDVDADAYYMAAVRWAEQNGITGGIGGGLFGSDLDCTREQIVTFIFRMMAD